MKVIDATRGYVNGSGYWELRLEDDSVVRVDDLGVPGGPAPKTWPVESAGAPLSTENAQ